MRTHTLLVAALALISIGCRDTELPPSTALQPGVFRATLFTALPGRSELSAATGATVTLVGSTQTAVADADGNVALSDLHASKGKLLFALDLNGDGTIDRSRSLTLESVGAGFGKEVNVGQLVLGRNATLVGKALRSDRAQINSGHGGIVVFLPQLPQLTVTGDDGSYLLPGVPEGEAAVSFTTPGYRAEASSLNVSVGIEQRIGDVVLTADPGGPTVGQLTGSVQQPDGTPIAAVAVRAVSQGREQAIQTNAEGQFTFPVLDTGVYVLGFEKSGLTPLRVDGVLLSAGVNQVGPYVMTAGSGSLGTLDGGTPAGLDAGRPVTPSDGGLVDAGPMGFGPIAIVTEYQAVPQDAQVTLNGTASTGAQPLIYSWSQLTDAGVTLDSNRTAASHSPRFTAPAFGTIIEFQLVVTDRFGRSSTNAAVTRVGVGGIPTAGFSPDGGTFTGGDSLTLISTSTDPGGLLLIGYQWSQVPAVAGATLVADGGTALLTFPPLGSGDPPVVVGVELVVTSSVGSNSARFRRSYAATPGSGANWSLRVLPVGTPILYNGANAPVTLDSTVSTSVSSPSISYSWSCPGLGSTVNGLPNGDAEFAVPAVVGLDRVVTCTLTATGSPPLSPAMLQASVGFSIRDDVDPTLVSSHPNFADTRSSPFGVLLRVSEPSSITVPFSSCALSVVEAAGNGTLLFSSTLMNATSCPAQSVNMTDTATVPNSASVPLTPIFNVTMVWRGPVVSTTDFADPRPALVSAGQLPFDRQAMAPPPAPVLPFELVAREGTNLVTFGTNWLTVPATCDPNCPMTGTLTPITGLNVAVAAPLGERVANAGQVLLVALQRETSGPLDTLYARRSPAGVWSSLVAGGELHNSGLEVRRMRLSGSALISDVYDPVSNTFVFPEQVLPDAGTDVVSINTGESHAWSRGTVSVMHSSGVTESFRRNSSTASWEPTTHHQPTNVLYGRTLQNDDSLGNTAFGFFVRSVPDHMMACDGNPRPVNTLGPVTGGFDFAQRFDQQFLAVSQGGDLRMYRGRASAMVAMAGPPRTVALPPGDNRFDDDPSCEAAYPRLAFIEDALVLTWQERCSPSTRWKIVTRVMR